MPALLFLLGIVCGIASAIVVHRLRRPSRAWARERALRGVAAYLHRQNPNLFGRN
jgi:predicted small secreted protein